MTNLENIIKNYFDILATALAEFPCDKGRYENLLCHDCPFKTAKCTDRDSLMEWLKEECKERR